MDGDRGWSRKWTSEMLDQGPLCLLLGTNMDDVDDDGGNEMDGGGGGSIFEKQL